MAEITFAQVNERGQLILLLSDDRVINVGNVVGPVGATGVQGVPGPKGTPGKDGAEIFLTAGPPDPAQGKPGDIAIDTRAWKLYQKSGMGWGMGNDMMPGANNLDAATRRFNSGGSGGGRFFGMGAPSAGIAGPPPTGNGLDPIYGHNKPLLASTPFIIASDPKGDVMHVLVFAQAATGSWYGEVVATRDANSDTAEVIAWETPLGATPPSLDFQATINAANVLELTMTSNIALTNVRGKVIYV